VPWWFVILLPPGKGNYVAKNALHDKVRRDKLPPSDRSERATQQALRDQEQLLEMEDGQLATLAFLAIFANR
jgi:hypothetical protein